MRAPYLAESYKRGPGLPQGRLGAYKLASPRENLVKCMGYEMISIDELVKRSGLSMTEVMCYLAELEIRGEVISMLGNYVRVIR